MLGYIFEQYINDRAQMGAYYTKEDITEYLGRNCILPFLFDKVRGGSKEMEQAFSDKGFVWNTLRQSGDRYVYDAVKHGYSADWRNRIPENIARGLDTTQPNLLERRADWNTRTPEGFGLPTEIWRETVERLTRCESIPTKVADGEIHEINDFITYNLDIRAFAQDLLEQTDNHHFVAHFYHALQSVTILDPTCGSGAFLFAAMNILEPLYEVCINRMEDFNKSNPQLFKEELNEITQKYRSNIQYFIYKSIILRNLYGVDIMAEAVEIAKLRLFLKMVAVVEVDRRATNLGLDPLPDIDFNIRCGNTLVGYVSEADAIAGASADLFTQAKFRDKMQDEMTKVSMAYDTFRTIQLSQHEDMVKFKEAKTELRTRLTAFIDLLNRQLFSHSGGVDYDAWLASHQPFHWIAEYYQIIHGNGGFDVIIGNPPYVEYKVGKFPYTIYGYETISCGNLYAFIIERCLLIGKSLFGYIVPSASIATPRMAKLSKYLMKNHALWTSIWDERPSKLFDGVDQQLSIHIFCKSSSQIFNITNMRHWSNSFRKYIFNDISYQKYELNDILAEVLPKIGTNLELCILRKVLSSDTALPTLYDKKSGSLIYYKNAGGRYWRQVKSFPTYFRSATSNTTSTEKSFGVKKDFLPSIVCTLSSSLFYMFWRIVSNCRHLTSREFDAFRVYNQLPQDKAIQELFVKFEKSLDENKQRSITTSKQSGEIQQDFYFIKLSKPIIDEIDKVLAKHYGFTEEELDFIINYDIKYRMGDELNADEE